MTAVATTPLTQRLAAVGLRPRLGLEFDVLGITAARIRKTRGGWEFGYARTLPATAMPPRAPHLSADALLQTLFSVPRHDMRMLRRAASVAQCACVLPMDLCTLTMLELPEAPPEELDQMIAFELAAEAESRSDVVFDYWQLTELESASNSMNRFAGISAADRDVRRAAEFINGSGLRLVAIDSLPTAAARAIALLPRRRPETTTTFMAVHIGSGRTTLVIVANGCPVFTRVLTTGTFTDLLSVISTKLDIPVPAVRRILRELPRQQTARLSRSFAATILRVIRDWSEPLCEEILRSMAFVGRPGMRCVPGQLVLMGPGSSVCGLNRVIEYQTNMVCRLWTPSRQPAQFPVSEFAIPAALSVTEGIR